MKQDDRFFRLMHAVDDDLLEEAMQPVRRRRHVWIPLAAAACLCIAAALAAVPLLRAPARQDVQPDGTQKQSGTSATEAAVPSSITTDAKAIMDLGYTLAVPADSQDVVYSLVPTDSDIPMAQVCYVSNGISYTARSLKTDSAADLTGSSANWTQELSWSDAGLAMDLRTDGEESWVGWYTGSTGTQWALGAEDSAQSVLHSACGILKTLGYDVAVAPEDAENVTYSVFRMPQALCSTLCAESSAPSAHCVPVLPVYQPTQLSSPSVRRSMARPASLQDSSCVQFADEPVRSAAESVFRERAV